MIKRIIHIGLWVSGILGFLAFEIFAIQKNNNTQCKELKINLINKKHFPALTSAEEIRTELLENYLPIEGQKLKSLNLNQIENNLSRITYLREYNAYLYINGNMAVTATSRKAILRVYNKASQHFYLGSDTVVMPLSAKHGIRLILASGALPKLNSAFFNPGENDILNLPDIYKKIYILATKIQKDEFLNALIDQIYVKPDQEFELIPKAGVGFIEFGDINNVDDKLKRLKNFYIKGKEKINWNIYSSINLKYDNQVICTKK